MFFQPAIRVSSNVVGGGAARGLGGLPLCVKIGAGQFETGLAIRRKRYGSILVEENRPPGARLKNLTEAAGLAQIGFKRDILRKRSGGQQQEQEEPASLFRILCLQTGP